MKKTIFLLLCLFILIISVSCVEQSDITEEDKKYIVLFEDVKLANIENEYTIKSIDNGKDYFFTKKNSSEKTLSCLYSQTLQDKIGGNEILLKVSVGIETNLDRAQQLYKSILKSPNKKATPSDYFCEEVSLEVKDETFNIILRKSRLVYNLSIDGISINENEIQEIIIEKIKYLVTKYDI